MNFDKNDNFSKSKQETQQRLDTMLRGAFSGPPDIPTRTGESQTVRGMPVLPPAQKPQDGGAEIPLSEVDGR
jgi:hypothetical protein